MMFPTYTIVYTIWIRLGIGIIHIVDKMVESCDVLGGLAICGEDS